MQSSLKKRWRRLFMPLLLVVALVVMSQAGGCYYMQAVGGQLEVLRKREPIAEVIADPAQPEDIKARLSMVLEARRFAVDELQLPDNDSYRSYTDLERDFVVWNVFAAPEFSLEAKTWCFPVVGCVAYRGYFAEASARKLAAKLAEQGYDVHVGGVPAYSTLGRFDDPVLNTMLRWTDATLVSTLFHELAHQKLFVKGDTAFNESFATAVAEMGMARWQLARGESADLAGVEARNELQTTLTLQAETTKRMLEALYAESIDENEMRKRKRELLDELSDRATEKARQLGFADAGWLKGPLNNARLASSGLYRGQLPAFRQLLSDCDDQLGCFYAAAAELKELPADQRQRRLDELGRAAEAAGP